MLIDWFTVGAQALNFVILVWLLKRFLYQPVLDAIDTREAGIARQIADAQTMQRDAREQSENFRSKTERFEHDRAAMLAQATSEADAERARLISAARQAADDLSARRQEAMEREAVQLNRDLRERTRREVYAISRKALTDLASTDLEALMVEAFARRIQELRGDARTELLSALDAAHGAALVRSAFELSPAQRATIQAAVVELPGASCVLKFEIEAELVSGIELIAGGYKVSWNIAHYLDSMEDFVSKIVKPEPEANQALPQNNDSSQNESAA